ncbi:leukocyte elastase inhibitor-like protein [Labeo rohita]|uniref:Leukocyte elastase inhibitor n=1 Tax=Labeo rohita TaxID=84645 RepID=A0A498M9F1_LABRO|nr:leukocyte elastase inhibitor-like protein [Labeo rohita]
MVSLGAKGNTAVQMFKVLGFTSPGATTPADQIHSNFNKLMSELNKPGVPYARSLANRLYGEQSYQFIEKFLNDTERYYNAKLEKVDFKKNSEAVHVDINKWVEKKNTRKDKVLAATRKRQCRDKTNLGDCHLLQGELGEEILKGSHQRWTVQAKQVKMMNKKSEFPLAFIPGMNSQVLELPYVGKNLSMLIILPNKIEDETTGLQKLVKMECLSAANTQFSLNLFKKISGGNASKNVFYSPISVSSALAMVSLGAKENTAAQMLKVLGFTTPPRPCTTPGSHVSTDQIHSSFNKLMSELNKPGVPYLLSIANRLYGDQSYQSVEKFLNDTKKYYEAKLEKVDFKKNPEAARVSINTWVEKKTQDKIKELLQRDHVSPATKLILVNAIYFKGNWEKKFPKEATKDGQFKLNKTQTKPVKMMNHQSKFPLASIPEMNSQVLELPYVGKNLSMLIILPNKIEDETTGLQKLERALTYEKLMDWTKPSQMLEQKVQVSLPKFKMTETYDMKNLLISMGIEDVFDGRKVNLSGMSPNNDLVLSGVIHKAFVEVNEEGTEAAAATATVGVTASRPVDPKTFKADHPFLFFIRHNPSNSILFFGRFCSP